MISCTLHVRYTIIFLQIILPFILLLLSSLMHFKIFLDECFAGGERKGWFRYTDNIGTRNPWVQKLFSTFREDAVKLRKMCGSPVPSPASVASKVSPFLLPGSGPATTAYGSLDPINKKS
jgi:hypothetical protein